MQRGKIMNIHRKKLKIFFIFLILINLFAYLSMISGLVSENLIVSYIMVIPGACVSMAIYRYEKNKLNYLNYILIGTFIILSLIMVTYILFGYLGIEINNFLINLFQIVVSISSISIIIYLLITSYDKNNKLNIFKNFKKGIRYIGITILFMLIISLFLSINYQDVIFNLIISIFSILTMILYYIGQEYAWRGYLQDIFQDKYGNILGILLLSILIELIHFPIMYTYLKMDTFGIILNEMIIMGMGIFLGYVYMKTRNVWICSFIQFLVNIYFVSIGISKLNKEVLFTNTNIGYFPIILSLVFFTFVFTKEYRKNLY
ncbi:CAAX amino terminal protease family protein [Gemelliphila asaccharolytica]|uniref:CAAX amino terminal protease family protein n=2 Tax=Gemelliphila asaccharolytica TaxID=502393 RepID=A0ABR5TMI8_9BACL|nr:CAAX amino terminal protease family protein [Gemella asaccharolytica]